MSKLKRLLGALSLVALFTFSSCVDDSVAPEVSALRQAQVDLLNAEVAFQNAETALKNADVAYRQAQTAGVEATTAGTIIANSQAQSNADLTIATNLNALAIAAEMHKENLIAREKALLDAQADLAQFLATQGLEEAAEYLAAWNSLMTGGSANIPGSPDFVVANGGIAGLTNLIAAKQASIASLELFFSSSLTNVPQSVVIERAQEAAVLAEANVVATNAAVEAADALVAGAEDPAAPLKLALKALAEDTIAQNARVDSIEAQITALSLITEDADSIVSAFENQNAAGTSNRTGYTSVNISGVHADNYVTSGNTWVTNKNTIDAEDAKIAIASADTTTWLLYADTLEGVYNKYASTVESFESFIKPFRDDSTAAKNALDAASPGDATLAANEVAYAAYIAQLELFAVKSNNFLNGLTLTTGANTFFGNGYSPGNDDEVANMTGATYTGNTALIVAANRPTLADTTALVSARTAWDGLTKNLMFTNYTATRYGAGQGGTRFSDAVIVTDGNKLNGTESAGGIANGSDNPYNNAYGTVDPALTAAVNLANALLVAAEEQYDNVIAEFDDLKAHVAAVRAFTENTGAFVGTAIPADLSSSGKTFGDYVQDVTDAADVLDLPIEATPDNEGLKQHLTAKAANDALKAAVAAKATANDNIDDILPAVTAYISDYEASLKLLKDATDSIATLTIPLEFARFGALETLGALEDQMEDIQTSITSLENNEVVVDDNGNVSSQPVVIFTTPGGMEFNTITQVSDWSKNAKEAGGAIDAAEDAASGAQKAVVEAEAGLLTLQGMLDKANIELSQLQTQLAVYQTLADELQALLEAALAG